MPLFRMLLGSFLSLSLTGFGLRLWQYLGGQGQQNSSILCRLSWAVCYVPFSIFNMVEPQLVGG